MINLKKFYEQNIKETDYYYKFYDFIITDDVLAMREMEDVFGIPSEYKQEEALFEIFDDEDAIKKFRDLCEPNLSFYQNHNTCLFYTICYYLYKMGYQITEFPRLLERPPLDPTEFTTNDIRNRAFKLNLDDNGTVRYQIRRKIVEDLHFNKKDVQKIDENLNLKFQEISTRNAKFENMATDEKIKEIANLLENLLKENGNYIKLDYSNISLNTLDDDTIKEFRKRIQCFRHSSNESIMERKQFTERQKKFIIDYGIMLCNLIYYNK